MKNDKLVPGMILVSIGAIFLLHNFGYLHFHWENFATLWPLFIIVPGVLLLLGLSHSAWAAILRGIIIVGAVLLLLFGDFGRGRFRWWPHWTYHRSDDSNYDDSDDDDNGPDSAGITKISGNSVFSEPYHADVKVARLNISGGA